MTPEKESLTDIGRHTMFLYHLDDPKLVAVVREVGEVFLRHDLTTREVAKVKAALDLYATLDLRFRPAVVKVSDFFEAP